MERILFLTGRLAHHSLEKVLAGMAPAPFEWEVRELGLQVAGLMTADMIQRRLPPATFGITLNPGHLIGLDEWLSSPIFAGSDIPLASGMAMQMDVIPAHPRWGSTRMEDGYVIADQGLRDDLARKHPNLSRRCALRAEVMQRVIGMDVPETLLPLADTCGILAPWLLDPAQVVVL